MYLKVLLLTTLVSAAWSKPQQSVAEIVPPTSESFYPTSSENIRFSRLLHQNANVLRFTSISNDAPSILRADRQNEIPTNFGRRSLDYEQDNENAESKTIITRPSPGNEYVYIRHGDIQTEQSPASFDVNVSPPVSDSILQKPMSRRIPLALLRQTNWRESNIKDPVFADEPPTTTNDVPKSGRVETSRSSSSSRSISRAHQEQPAPFTRKSVVSEEVAEATTVSPNYYSDSVELTTVEPNYYEDAPESNETKNKQQMIVNVVTSAPRVVFDNTTSVNEVTVPSTSTTTPKPSSSTSTTTTSTTTTTPKPDDEKENLVEASARNFPDFEDTPTRLQTAETSQSQPHRVNVRPAASGKDYEYEYIYYYYDDEGDNATSNANDSAVSVSSTTSIPTTTTRVTTTTTTTPAPIIEYEYEDEEDEIKPEVPVPTRKTTPAPDASKQFLQEKIIPQSPANVLEQSRSPKSFSNTEYIDEYDGEFHQDLSGEEDIDEAPVVPKSGQRLQTESNPCIIRLRSNQPIGEQVQTSTASPALGFQDMPTLPKSHPSSINRPVVLKMSNLSPTVTAKETISFVSTTPTPVSTVETVSTENNRANINRFSRPRNPTKSTQQEYSVVEQPHDEQIPSRRPTLSFTREPSSLRRNPVRRPQTEDTTNTETSQSQQNEDVNRLPPHPRTRFPPRTTAPITEVSTEAAVQNQEIVTEDDTKSKDNFARAKSINDLYAFTRLQQAISSRVPSRKTVDKTPKVGGFISTSSAEQTTDAGSSEVTTSSPISYQSAEVVSTAQEVSSAAPTTTTTEEVRLDRFGKPRNRYRGRRPGKSNNDGTSEASRTTTESSRATSAPISNAGNRFGTNRRRNNGFTRTTVAPLAETSEESVTATRQPVTRNRFATRRRTSTTEASVATDNQRQDETSSEQPATTTRRQRPHFTGRRRQQGTQTTAEVTETVQKSEATPTVENVAPTVRGNADSERRRFNFGNPARNRPSGPHKLRQSRIGNQQSTTEAAPVEQSAEAANQHGEIIEQQQPTIEEQPPQEQTSTTEAPKRGSAGVLGKLRSRAKIAATTTTPAPAEKAIQERKPSRLSGILNRRKNLHTTTTIPVAPVEESQNNGQEQDDHKGVVVQVSTTVTESEEVSEQKGGGEQAEEVEPSSTPASILKRLKAKRKPGAVFRKRPIQQPQEQSQDEQK